MTYFQAIIVFCALTPNGNLSDECYEFRNSRGPYPTQQECRIRLGEMLPDSLSRLRMEGVESTLRSYSSCIPVKVALV